MSHHLPHGGRNRVAIELVRNFLEIGHDELKAALANLVKTMRGTAHHQVETIL